MVIIGLLNTKILINQNTDLKFASLIGMGIFLEDKKMNTKYCTLNLVSLEMIQEADTFFFCITFLKYYFALMLSIIDDYDCGISFGRIMF